MNPPRPAGSLIGHFSRRITRSGGINLAQGKPGFPPPPRLLRRLAEAAEVPINHQYAPGNGDFHLLEVLAAWPGWPQPLRQENLLIVQGATEGVFLSLFTLSRHLSGARGVLAFDPPYESYPRLPEIMGLPFHAFATDADGAVDFRRLDATVRREGIRIILLASPGNPLGRVWNREELDRLIAVLDNVDGWLIFDAVYSGLYYRDAPALPPLPAHPRVIYVDSFSKRLSITGWRVGFMAAPPDTMARIRAIHDFTGLSAPSLAQAALARYLEESDFGADYTRECRLTCARNHALMNRELTAAGFRVAAAGGGYFVWARCPGSRADGYALAETLLEAGVGVVPGENFSPRFRDFLRLNIATDTETVAAGAARIRAHLES